MSYPILVERWDANHPSDLVVCETCHDSFRWDPGKGSPDELCAECACGGPLTWKYDEAPKCGGCGKLGYWSNVLKGCCSRACMLQSEYAATLKERA
jgi:hypothetical protein